MCSDRQIRRVFTRQNFQSHTDFHFHAHMANAKLTSIRALLLALRAIASLLACLFMPACVSVCVRLLFVTHLDSSCGLDSLCSFDRILNQHTLNQTKL